MSSSSSSTTSTLTELGSNSSSNSSSSSTSSSILNSNQIQIPIDNNGGHLTMSVTNVVCSFSTRCHLNLRKIALHGMHVEYKKENNMVSMKLRKPSTTASMWSSGKCTCTGAQSTVDAYKAARRYCRILQKMNFRIKLSNYRVVNVLATCSLPFQLDVVRLAEQYPSECSYEPELHPGATFKVSEYRATLKLFSTGSITLTAPSVDAARQAVQSIYSILERFKFDQKPTITQIKLETTKNTLKPPTESQDSSSNRLENLEINNTTTTTTSNNSHFNSSHNNNNHYNHHHHPPPTLVHYDPWSNHHHLNHHNHHNLNHHYNHSLTLNGTGGGGVSGVGASTIDMNDTGGHLSHLNHLHHHHHLHHLPPPPQPPQPASSAHHWFGDNLLIDNVLDDFLQ